MKLVISAKRQNGQTVYFWYDKNSLHKAGISWSESLDMAFDFFALNNPQESAGNKLSQLRGEFHGLSGWKIEKVKN